MIDVPEAGLTMRAPSGWRVHRPDAALICSKGDSTGIALVDPLGGETFVEYVSSRSTEFGGRVVPSTSLSISGCDAVRTVVDYPAEDFSGHKALLLDSAASIRIE